MKDYMSTYGFMKNDPKQLFWKVIWKANGEYKVCMIDDEHKFHTNVIPISHIEEIDKTIIKQQYMDSVQRLFANDAYHQCISKEFLDDIQTLLKGCKRISTTYKVVKNDATESEHDYTDESVDLYMKDLISFTIDGEDLKEKYSKLSAFPVVLLARRYILDHLAKQRRGERTIRRTRRTRQYTRITNRVKRNLERDGFDPVCKKIKK